MEKTIIKNLNGDDCIQLLPDGRELVSYEMTFTADEKEHLRSRILNKFEGEPVWRFTRILEELCRAEYRILNLPKQTDADLDNNIADLLSICNKAVKQLHKVSRCKLPLITFNKINFNLKEDNGIIIADCHNRDDVEWWSKTMRKATTARNSLLDFIECFDQKPMQAKGKVGRSKADSSGFVKEIANAYKLCFNTPAKKSSLTFQGIVLFALEAVGSKHIKDPTRQIKNALSTP